MCAGLTRVAEALADWCDAHPNSSPPTVIHVTDGARACLAALDKAGNGETYNASDDEPALRRDFYNHLAMLLKAAPPKFITPGPDQPAPPHEGTNRRVSNLKLKRELLDTLQFPSFREGLENCVNLGAFQ